MRRGSLGCRAAATIITGAPRADPQTGSPMIRTLRAGALTAAAAALMLALAGCVGPRHADAARRRRPPTADPSIRADVRRAGRPARRRSRRSSRGLRPSSCATRMAASSRSLDYLSTPADAVAALTTSSARARVRSPTTARAIPAQHGVPLGRFVLWEQLYDGLGGRRRSRPRSLRPRFPVQCRPLPRRGGVELASSDGRHVGEAWAELDRAIPTVAHESVGVLGSVRRLRRCSRTEPDSSCTVSVEFRPTDDEAAIAGIGAPLPVYEDGCA